jgi:predicted RNA-binding protein with TRAM domain
MAKPRRGDTFELTIDDLAFGGEGVGRVDGYVIFVRGGLPGDRVRVRLVEARGRFGRATIEEVVAASPDRVEPPCVYFGQCGGCRLQHLAYPAQLTFKEKQVRDCLERLGGVGDFELRPILPAPEPYGYRNKMEFTVAHDPPTIGLHAAERYDVVLDIERCLLQSESTSKWLHHCGSAIWIGWCIRSPVMTASRPSARKRTLVWPGVWPGVGSSQISSLTRWSISTSVASPASSTGLTLSSMIRFVSSSRSLDQCSHSRRAKR